MFVSIENCEGGFLIEVRLDTTDPTFLVMQGHRDFKRVATTYPEVEEFVAKLFGQEYVKKVPTITKRFDD